MRRNIQRLLTAGLACLAASAVLAQPASADAQNYLCYTGEICVFSGADRTGLKVTFTKCTMHYLQRQFPVGTPDGVSSWNNRQTGGAVAIFYDGDKQVLFSAPVGKGNVPPRWNDTAMYIKPC
jgi:hypothetical protein